jgi:hypothetical protein
VSDSSNLDSFLNIIVKQFLEPVPVPPTVPVPPVPVQVDVSTLTMPVGLSPELQVEWLRLMVLFSTNK